MTGPNPHKWRFAGGNPLECSTGKRNVEGLQVRTLGSLSFPICTRRSSRRCVPLLSYRVVPKEDCRLSRPYAWWWLPTLSRLWLIVAAENLHRDLEDLTPLDARNSLLMDPIEYRSSSAKGARAYAYPPSTYSDETHGDAIPLYRDQTPPPRRWGRRESDENLVQSAASMGRGRTRSARKDSDSISPPAVGRQPRLPNMENRGVAL